MSIRDEYGGREGAGEEDEDEEEEEEDTKILPTNGSEFETPAVEAKSKRQRFRGSIGTTRKGKEYNTLMSGARTVPKGDAVSTYVCPHSSAVRYTFQTPVDATLTKHSQFGDSNRTELVGKVDPIRSDMLGFTTVPKGGKSKSVFSPAAAEEEEEDKEKEDQILSGPTPTINEFTSPESITPSKGAISNTFPGSCSDEVEEGGEEGHKEKVNVLKNAHENAHLDSILQEIQESVNTGSSFKDSFWILFPMYEDGDVCLKIWQDTIQSTNVVKNLDEIATTFIQILESPNSTEGFRIGTLYWFDLQKLERQFEYIEQIISSSTLIFHFTHFHQEIIRELGDKLKQMKNFQPHTTSPEEPMGPTTNLKSSRTHISQAEFERKAQLNSPDIDEFVFLISFVEFRAHFQRHSAFKLAGSRVGSKARGLYQLVKAVENLGHSYTALVQDDVFNLLALNDSTKLVLSVEVEGDVFKQLLRVSRSPIRSTPNGIIQPFFEHLDLWTKIRELNFIDQSPNNCFKISILCTNLADTEFVLDELSSRCEVEEYTHGVMVRSIDRVELKAQDWRQALCDDKETPGTLWEEISDITDSRESLNDDEDLISVLDARMTEVKRHRGENVHSPMILYVRSSEDSTGISQLPLYTREDYDRYFVEVQGIRFKPVLQREYSAPVVSVPPAPGEVSDEEEDTLGLDTEIPVDKSTNSGRSSSITGKNERTNTESFFRACEIMKGNGWDGVFIYEQHGLQLKLQDCPISNVPEHCLPKWLIDMQQQADVPYFRLARAINFDLGTDVIPLFTLRDPEVMVNNSGHKCKTLVHTIGNVNLVGTGMGGAELQFRDTCGGAVRNVNLPVSGCLYQGGWKRLVTSLIGSTRFRNIFGIHPTSIQGQRQSFFEEGFINIAKDHTSRQSPGYNQVCRVRLELVHAGFTAAQATINQNEYFKSLDCNDLMEIECSQRSRKLFQFLVKHNLDVYTVPFDVMMSGVQKTLQEYDSIIVKYCALQRSKKNTSGTKDPLTQESRKCFVIAHAHIFAELGIRKTKTYAPYESRIFTDFTANRRLACDLVENLAMVETRHTDNHGISKQGVTVVRITENKRRAQQQFISGVSTSKFCGTCPRCSKLFPSAKEVKEQKEGLKHANDRYSLESQHVLECTGDKLKVETSFFMCQDDESLQDIAFVLETDVYVLLSLNISSDLTGKGILLLVTHRMQPETRLIVPRSIHCKSIEDTSGSVRWERPRPDGRQSLNKKRRDKQNKTHIDPTFASPRELYTYFAWRAKNKQRKRTNNSFDTPIFDLFNWR